MKYFILVFVFFLFSSPILKTINMLDENTEDIEHKKKYEQNAFKDSINGVYIPKDLYEAMDMLDTMFNEESKKEISQLINAAETIQYHLGSGMGIRNRWGLWVNSRLANYFEKLGFSHPDNMSSIILRAFWYYLKDYTIYLKVHNYNNFKEDGNLFFYMYYKSSGENNFYSLNLNILKADTLGRTTFYCPFEQSEFISYKHDNPDALLNDFRLKLYDYSSHDFLDTLSVYFKQHGYLFQGGYSLDSLLFIKDPNSNDIEYFLNAFKQYINKDSLINEMKVEKYNIYYNVGKSELDSIDNILYQYNKKAIEDNYYDDNDKWTNFYNIVMKEYLAKKLILDLYVIRFYPYVKFDFKEYKKKKRNYIPL